MILATAFTPFGAAATNASEDLLRAVGDDPGVTRAVLPTEYERASREIVRLIRELRPSSVVCFGLASGADAVRLERVARNWDASPAPDNAGQIRNGQAITPGAPALYQATLRYDTISVALSARGIPHIFSDDAGGYVCNHTFFCARHEIEESGRAISCGFVHLPPVKGPEEFAMLLEAVKICIAVRARLT
jgi:pyroglutamyl-peptidase